MPLYLGSEYIYMGYYSEFDTAVSRDDFSRQLILCSFPVGIIVIVLFPEGVDHIYDFLGFHTHS